MSRILVVDDDADMREILSSVLGRAGFHVMVAEGGAEALRLAERVVPDLVLTDMNMPEMTGGQLCRALRAHPVLGSVRTAVLSGTLQPAEPCCQEAGGCVVLLEPMPNDQLVAAVRRLLQQDSPNHNERPPAVTHSFRNVHAESGSESYPS